MIRKIHVIDNSLPEKIDVVIDNSLPEKIDVVIMNKEQDNDRN